MLTFLKSEKWAKFFSMPKKMGVFLKSKKMDEKKNEDQKMDDFFWSPKNGRLKILVQTWPPPLSLSIQFNSIQFNSIRVNENARKRKRA